MKKKLFCSLKIKFWIGKITKSYIFFSKTDEEGLERIYCIKIVKKLRIKKGRGNLGILNFNFPHFN
ncbi:MAG: hypothetical protein ACUVUG_03285 [Candidatus Aminicenantia bacterium]